MKKYLIIALLLVASIGTYLVLRPSEEKKIRKLCTRLSETFSKSPGEKITATALKMNILGTFFTEKCELELVNFPGSGTYSPNEIVGKATRARAGAESITLKFDDVTFVHIGETSAEVDLTATLIYVSSGGTSHRAIREILVRLKKVEGKWKFSEFEEVQVLEK